VTRTRKPNRHELNELRRLVLEKLVMGRNWGMNYIAMANVPKGLPKEYPEDWYLYEIDNLVRDGLLLVYKKADPIVRLNIARKAEIERLVGT